MPALGGQVQASPGDVVQTWFKADEVGRYEGSSTIFSGTAYPAMRSWVRVVTVPEYQAYIERLGAELAEAQDAVASEQQREESAPNEPARRHPLPRARRSSPARSPSPRQGWIERATSADHKIVGLLYIATALTFLALAATQFALMRVQLIVPENTLLKPGDLRPADDHLGGHLRRPRLRPARRSG